MVALKSNPNTVSKLAGGKWKESIDIMCIIKAIEIS